MDDATPHEIDFFEWTLALLEGRNIHKRFGNVNSIGKEVYNPIKNSTPKKAGFGER